MKTLKVEYGGINIFEGPVDAFAWAESSSEVSVTGKLSTQRAAKPGAGNGGVSTIIDMLTSASKQKTESMVESKRSAIDTAVGLVSDEVASTSSE